MLFRSEQNRLIEQLQKRVQAMQSDKSNDIDTNSASSREVDVLKSNFFSPPLIMTMIQMMIRAQLIATPPTMLQNKSLANMKNLMKKTLP